MMQTMQVRPVHNVPNARAHLGSSEYQKCVAHGPTLRGVHHDG